MKFIHPMVIEATNRAVTCTSLAELHKRLTHDGDIAKFWFRVQFRDPRYDVGWRTIGRALRVLKDGSSLSLEWEQTHGLNPSWLDYSRICLYYSHMPMPFETKMPETTRRTVSASMDPVLARVAVFSFFTPLPLVRTVP